MLRRHRGRRCSFIVHVRRAAAAIASERRGPVLIAYSESGRSVEPTSDQRLASGGYINLGRTCSARAKGKQGRV
jgi:hypothetical protein